MLFLLYVYNKKEFPEKQRKQELRSAERKRAKWKIRRK